MASAKELIRQNAVKVNGKAVVDMEYKVKSGDKIKVGARTFLYVV